MKEINFNPYTANVLDYVCRELVSVDGKRVMIAQSMNGEFMIYVDGKLAESGMSNIVASSVLNRLQCRPA